MEISILLGVLGIAATVVVGLLSSDTLRAWAAGFCQRVWAHRLTMRWRRRRRPERAERKFKELREGLNGLREQATFEGVQEPHRVAIASALASLDIWPQAIRGERSQKMIEAEADYLNRCTGSRFGLKMAREKFPKGGPQEWRCRTDSQGEFMGDEYHQDLFSQYYDTAGQG